MNRGQLLVNRFVHLDPPGLDVLLEKIVDRNHPVFLEDFGVPVLQTKPGRIVGVPSLRQEKGLALQPLQVLHNATH